MTKFNSYDYTLFRKGGCLAKQGYHEVRVSFTTKEWEELNRLRQVQNLKDNEDVVFYALGTYKRITDARETGFVIEIPRRGIWRWLDSVLGTREFIIHIAANPMER